MLQNQLLFSGPYVSWLLLTFPIWVAFTFSPLDLSSVITSVNFFLHWQVCLPSCHPHVLSVPCYKVCSSSCSFILKVADLSPSSKQKYRSLLATITKHMFLWGRDDKIIPCKAYTWQMLPGNSGRDEAGSMEQCVSKVCCLTSQG